MHQIRKGLLLASLDDILDKTEQLFLQNVTHILTVDSQELPPRLKVVLEHHGIRIDYIHMLDEPNFNLFGILECAMLELNCRKSTDTTVVHCFAGVSRSASIIIAYLMKTEEIDFDQALECVRRIKPDIYPNPGFQEQLRIFGKMGNVVDRDHPLLKKYNIEHVVSQKGSYKSNNLEIQDDDQNLQLLDVKCKKCRKSLLNPANIRHFASIKCSSLFLIEPEKWMTITTEGDQEGKLYCPRCQAKLGSYNWQGTMSCCNKNIKPSFQVTVSKVDLKFAEDVTR